MHQLEIKRQRQTIGWVGVGVVGSISTTKHLPGGNRLRSLLSCKYQPYLTKKANSEGRTEIVHGGSMSLEEQLTGNRTALSREMVTYVRPNFRIL